MAGRRLAKASFILAIFAGSFAAVFLIFISFQACNGVSGYEIGMLFLYLGITVCAVTGGVLVLKGYRIRGLIMLWITLAISIATIVVVVTNMGDDPLRTGFLFFVAIAIEIVLSILVLIAAILATISNKVGDSYYD